jgi:uncharacterized membrane protein
LTQDDQFKQLISENAQINALLRAQADAGRTQLHRPIERLATVLSHPLFSLSALLLALAWIVVNTDLQVTRHRAWDTPPFFWLQGVVGALSLVITTTVLVSQSRQGQLAEQRADLQLQVTLLTEQRTAKLIELLEELRRDLPNVQDRRDEQAEAMQQPGSATAILEALDSAPVGPEPIDPGGP